MHRLRFRRPKWRLLLASSYKNTPPIIIGGVFFILKKELNVGGVPRLQQLPL